MLTARIEGNELLADGNIQVGDIYPGFCCAGHNYTVALVLVSAWGQCDNPICTGRNGTGIDHYQGVSNWDVEDFALRLAEMPALVTA